ncbi:hypothetical protein bsdcttw_19420 [Anaerocolumna chitinilytica]|uniref:Uncharacterized protein n=1 Tax=Anaerocolumna chitinilytica TaxID=1727145 RepID=A0A7I8DNN9_9FIRM|nr:hypothetical protein bsdcttw_19420 [Anaerocolumna chitinilytica]
MLRVSFVKAPQLKSDFLNNTTILQHIDTSEITIFYYVSVRLLWTTYNKKWRLF